MSGTPGHTRQSKILVPGELWGGHLHHKPPHKYWSQRVGRTSRRVSQEGDRTPAVASVWTGGSGRTLNHGGSWPGRDGGQVFWERDQQVHGE